MAFNKSICIVGPSRLFLSGISYYTIRLANTMSSKENVSVVCFRQLLPTFLFPGKSHVGKDISDLNFLSGIPIFDGMDYNNIKDKLKSYLLKHKLKFIYYFLREADEGVGAYFRGLILVMNLMAMAAGLGFYFVGLDYPLLFGFIVGYTNAIPIIGNYIGGIPAIFFALTKSFELALLSLVVIVIVQLIESNIVTPYIQSKSIDSHPLLILLAFIIFGRYFGFLGMVFAIPLLAIFLLIIKYIRIYFRLKSCQNKNKKLNKVS